MSNDTHELFPIRTLKIEADGDRWKKQIKPKIRLTGKWLERFGFRPESRVRVTFVAPGVIELRAMESSQQPITQP